MSSILVECADGSFVGVGGVPFTITGTNNVELSHSVVICSSEYDGRGLCWEGKRDRRMSDVVDLAEAVALRLRDPHYPGVLRRADWFKPLPPKLPDPPAAN